MRRRRYLASLGVGFAGCSSRPSTPGTDRTTGAPTTTPPGTRTPADAATTTLESNEPYRTPGGWVVRVSVLRARRGIVAAGDPPTPVVPADRQFLQVLVRTGGEGAPPPADLCLAAAVDGDRPVEGCPARVEAVRPDRLGNLQAVPVPLEFGGGEAAVVWDREGGPPVRWTLPPMTVDALRRPPAFSVEDVSVPDAVPSGEAFDVGVTVRNAGGRRDWFVAALGVGSGPGRPIELRYGPGEELTKTRELVADFDGADGLVVRLDWAAGEVKRRVRRAE